MLENIDYGSAILSIDEYLSLHKGLIKYEDPQLPAHRLELKALEKRLRYLDELYERYQKAKKDFESKEEKFHRQRKKAKKAKEKFDQQPENGEYEEARHNFEEFRSGYDDIRQKEQDRLELSEEEKIGLKNLYREAGKLCHPDIVPEEVRAKTTEIMQRLNEAYTKHDLESLRKILESLKSGAFLTPASET